MTYILIASFAVMVASLVGVVTVWKRVGKVIENNLDFLISFSAGVFAIIFYRLASETIEIAADIAVGIGWIFGGALFIWVAFKFMPRLHHHADDHEEHASEEDIDVRRMLLSDAIHNLGDGVLIAASFAASTSIGIAAAVSIFVHELLQEVSEFFVLRGGGYSSKQALALNFIISSTLLVGAVGGYFLLDTFIALEAPLLGIAAGALLVVILHDLIPHSVRNSLGTAHHMTHLIWFFIGVMLMFSITELFVHEPEGEHAVILPTASEV